MIHTIKKELEKNGMLRFTIKIDNENKANQLIDILKENGFSWRGFGSIDKKNMTYLYLHAESERVIKNDQIILDFSYYMTYTISQNPEYTPYVFKYIKINDIINNDKFVDNLFENII
jgi:hypothetical protein